MEIVTDELIRDTLESLDLSTSMVMKGWEVNVSVRMLPFTFDKRPKLLQSVSQKYNTEKFQSEIGQQFAHFLGVNGIYSIYDIGLFEIMYRHFCEDDYKYVVVGGRSEVVDCVIGAYEHVRDDVVRHWDYQQSSDFAQAASGSSIMICAPTISNSHWECALLESIVKLRLFLYESNTCFNTLVVSLPHMAVLWEHEQFGAILGWVFDFYRECFVAIPSCYNDHNGVFLVFRKRKAPQIHNLSTLAENKYAIGWLRDVWGVVSTSFASTKATHWWLQLRGNYCCPNGNLVYASHHSSAYSGAAVLLNSPKLFPIMRRSFRSCKGNKPEVFYVLPFASLDEERVKTLSCLCLSVFRMYSAEMIIDGKKPHWGVVFLFTGDFAVPKLLRQWKVLPEFTDVLVSPQLMWFN
jgi:hypothetical protein